MQELEIHRTDFPYVRTGLVNLEADSNSVSLRHIKLHSGDLNTGKDRHSNGKIMLGY